MNDILTLLILFGVLVFCIYYIVPKKHRYLVLLISSIIFYAIYSKFMICFIIVTIISIYFAGIFMNKLDDKFTKEKENLEKEQRKILKAKIKRKKLLILVVAILLNILILTLLKYSGFIASIFEGIFSWFNLTLKLPILKLMLPLGISYYTLSAIGYMIDVYRGKYRGDTNFFKVALFVSYFPQLYEGPFATYDKLAPQLYEGNEFDSKNAFSGLLLIVFGVLKKIVIADRLNILVSDIFKNYTSYHGLVVLLGIILFTFQLYAEFSAAIDIAVGSSEMLGIKLAKNFNQPFVSQSVNEFWRRWHISLGAWFREYIFYPVSMSKGMMKFNKKIHGKVSKFFELFLTSALPLFLVWFTNGLWHGANWLYVIYGLYYYILMMLGMINEAIGNKFYKKFNINKDNKVLVYLRIFRTFIFVNIGMLIFKCALSSSTISETFNVFASIFSGGKLNLISLKVIDIYDTIFCALGILTLLIIDVLKEHKIDLREKISNSNVFIKFIVLLIIIFVIVIFGAYGDGYIPADPIYGGF